MKIVFEREKCIGCGTCENLCPKYWRLDEDGKAKYLGPEELKDEEVGCNQAAAESCPVQCIKLEK